MSGIIRGVVYEIGGLEPKVVIKESKRKFTALKATIEQLQNIGMYLFDEVEATYDSDSNLIDFVPLEEE